MQEESDRLLLRGARLPRVGLDGRFFSFLRCGVSHTVNLVGTGTNALFHTAFELRDSAHLQTACYIFSKSGYKIIWGPGPPRHRPQSVHLSPRPERPDHRTVHRDRPDARGGTRLFRAAALV